MKVPKQIKEHKKKCLFSKEDVLSASTDTRNGYLSPTDSIKMTTQATLNTRSDNIDDVRLALLSIRLSVYIQKLQIHLNYLVEFTRFVQHILFDFSQQITVSPSISNYGGHMEAPLFPYAAPIIPRAPFNSNNGINGRLMKSKGRRPKRKTFKKEMKYLAHVPKLIRR